jgi:hypothetical protein
MHTTLAPAVCGHQIKPYPDHSVLDCKECHRNHGLQLIAAVRSGIRKASGNLVAPFQLAPAAFVESSKKNLNLALNEPL